MGQVEDPHEELLMAEPIESILTDLSSPDPETRESALDRVGAMKPPNAVEIIAPFLQDSDPEVRGTAACNLGIVGAAEGVPYLLGVLQEEPSEKVRTEALISLAAYQNPDVLDALVAEVQRPKRSRRPRQEVAKQLGNYDAEKAVDALISLLEDEDVFVRDHAAESLYKLNRPRLRRTWEQSLTDRSADIRELAAKALAEWDH
jgi:HEAT repeat protein